MISRDTRITGEITLRKDFKGALLLTVHLWFISGYNNQQQQPQQYGAVCPDYSQQQSIPQQVPQTANTYCAPVDAYGSGQTMPDNSGGYGQQGAVVGAAAVGGYDDRSATYGVGKW